MSNPSNPGHTNSLALWNSPPTDEAVNFIEWQQYRPLSQINQGSTIEFHVGGTGSNYLDLSRTKLSVSLKVVNADGTKLAKDTPVGPINLTHSSIFSSIDVCLQQKPITRIPPPLYSYKAYTDTLLNTTEDVKSTTLEGRLWITDMTEDMDSTTFPYQENVDTPPNYSLFRRAGVLAESQEITLIGPLHVDLFHQEKYILNGVPINIRLSQNTDQFRLMSKQNDYKLVITDCVLSMCHVNINPEVVLAHDKALQIAPAQYNFLQTDFKVFSIAKGQFSFTADNVYLGDVPSKVIAFLVPSEGYNGNIQRNPFNFINGNLNRISFEIDGRSVEFTPNYNTKNYTESYLALMQTCGKNHDSYSNGISLRDYGDGFTMYAFSVDCSNDSRKYLPKPRKGHTRITVSFAEALSESVNLILYAKFPERVMIDAARNVYL